MILNNKNQKLFAISLNYLPLNFLWLIEKKKIILKYENISLLKFKH